MAKKKLVAFDFDGTLTTKDSFVEFIKFCKGNFIFYSYIPLVLLFWISFKIKIISRHKAKEYVFALFFKGMSSHDFNTYCEKFSEKIDTFLRDSSTFKINSYTKENHEVVIVSASIENWIKPWATTHKISNIIATKVEIDAFGNLSGKFSSKNCRGKEKVDRLLEAYPFRNEYDLIAYGDSSGDAELLNFADESYYKSDESYYKSIV